MTSLPDFALLATDGRTVTSADLLGKTTVLYFYPKDNTPGCTNESIAFRELFADFVKANCDLYGISRDSIKSHLSFKAKLDLPFELLSDSNESACKGFGVIKLKNSYGRQVRGIERSTFVITPNGEIAQQWRAVKVPGHAEEVLAFVHQLA